MDVNEVRTVKSAVADVIGGRMLYSRFKSYCSPPRGVTVADAIRCSAVIGEAAWLSRSQRGEAVASVLSGEHALAGDAATAVEVAQYAAVNYGAPLKEAMLREIARQDAEGVLLPVMRVDAEGNASFLTARVSSGGGVTTALAEEAVTAAATAAEGEAIAAAAAAHAEEATAIAQALEVASGEATVMVYITTAENGRRVRWFLARVGDLSGEVCVKEASRGWMLRRLEMTPWELYNGTCVWGPAAVMGADNPANQRVRMMTVAEWRAGIWWACPQGEATAAAGGSRVVPPAASMVISAAQNTPAPESLSVMDIVDMVVRRGGGASGGRGAGPSGAGGVGERRSTMAVELEVTDWQDCDRGLQAVLADVVSARPPPIAGWQDVARAVKGAVRGEVVDAAGGSAGVGGGHVSQSVIVPTVAAGRDARNLRVRMARALKAVTVLAGGMPNSTWQVEYSEDEARDWAVRGRARGEWLAGLVAPGYVVVTRCSSDGECAPPRAVGVVVRADADAGGAWVVCACRECAVEAELEQRVMTMEEWVRHACPTGGKEGCACGCVPGHCWVGFGTNVAVVKDNGERSQYTTFVWRPLWRMARREQVLCALHAEGAAVEEPWLTRAVATVVPAEVEGQSPPPGWAGAGWPSHGSESGRTE